MHWTEAIRIVVPEDLIIDYDNYTKDDRVIQDFDYDVIVKIKGRWKVRNDLKLIDYGDWYKTLVLRDGYSEINVDKVGYLLRDDYEEYFK